MIYAAVMMWAVATITVAICSYVGCICYFRFQ